MFTPILCDSSGKPIIEGSGAYMPLPTADEIRDNPTIEYAYDWRLDPFDSAADLNDFINYICDDLGFGQVMIECHSNAGNIVLTYFAVYGTEKVRSCVFSATSIYGAGFAAELIEGKIIVNPEGIEEFLVSAFSNYEKLKPLTILVKIASHTKLIDWLVKIVNKVMTEGNKKFYSECAFPLFGNYLNIWAMVPDDKIDDGIRYCRENFNFDTENEYKDFYAALNRYSDVIRTNRETILDTVNENCNVYVFCMYDFPGAPVSADWNTMSDGILYSRDTSFGATFKGYIDTEKFAPGPYISPDGKVDASTAKFRDQTWYFKKCNHILKNDYLNKIAKDLLYYDGQATVNTFREYPQFLKFDVTRMNIVPA